VTLFDRWNNGIRQGEASLVNLLSAVAPWGAPLAPAYMSYGGMVNHLDYQPWVALILAGVIEILGLATVHTTLLFWQHNRRYRAEYKRQPVELAGGMFAFYLLVVLVVNVLLEWPTTSIYTPLVARGLLTMLSIPAAVTMALRTLHTEMLNEIKRNQEKPKETKNETDVSQTTPPLMESSREHVLRLHHEKPEATMSEIAGAVGISRQMVGRYIGQNGRPQ
jgi:hypothetical protein